MKTFACSWAQFDRVLRGRSAGGAALRWMSIKSRHSSDLSLAANISFFFTDSIQIACTEPSLFHLRCFLHCVRWLRPFEKWFELTVARLLLCEYCFAKIQIRVLILDVMRGLTSWKCEARHTYTRPIFSGFWSVCSMACIKEFNVCEISQYNAADYVLETD